MILSRVNKYRPFMILALLLLTLLFGTACLDDEFEEDEFDEFDSAQFEDDEEDFDEEDFEDDEEDFDEDEEFEDDEEDRDNDEGMGIDDASALIVPVPAHFSREIQRSFVKYTEVVAPNGGVIEILAQDELSDAQILRARNVLLFFLTDVPGSVYGVDKTAVANHMADNEARLLLLNGADEGNAPEIEGQELYGDELIVEGSRAYINNEYEEHRDAAFEEIFHLVHDFGIGVDVPQGSPGALPDFQAEVRAATENAMEQGLWADSEEEAEWLAELEREGSLTQEYIASVIDSYYGYWGAFTEAPGGMWGIYVAKTRDNMPTADPMGYALMDLYFSPYVTYNAHIDSEFGGTFSLAFDPNEPYTHKSQYLLYATLTGTRDAGLLGNDQANRLGGNAGDNVLDGGDGEDTAVYPNPMDAYQIERHSDGSITVIGDGTDTLISIEQIEFSDQVVDASDL